MNLYNITDQKNIILKLQSLYEQDTDILKGEIRIKEEHLSNETRVYKQALRHNIWLKEIDIIKDKFPQEGDNIWKYRNKNKRQFTKEIVRKIHQGIISVVTNIQIKVVSNNLKFNDWISSNPFSFKNSFYEFITWSINSVIPYALIDPNAILLGVPQFKGLNNVIGITPLIVSYNKKWIDHNGEWMVVIKEDNSGFWIMDKTQWWEVTKTGKGFDWTFMYEHNLGELPYESMPGISSFCVESKRKYNESIISSTYEILDEAIVSHTSFQAIKLKMQNILVRAGILCKTCNGDGKIQVPGETRWPDCQDCKGSGMAKRVGDHEDLVIKASEMIDSQGNFFKPFYLSPDVQCADFLKTEHQDLMEQGKKSVGIDALIDRAESGEAMKKRLGTFEEFMSYLIYFVYKTHLTKFFEIVQKLLEFNKENWKDFPQIQTPKRIEIKTPEILKLNFDLATGADRIQAALEYYKSKYAEDPVSLRTMTILTNFYPASIETNADLQSLILMGVFTKQEVAKAKRALPIVKTIIEKLGVAEKTDEKIFEEAEVILDKLIPDAIQGTEQPSNDTTQTDQGQNEPIQN